MTGEITLVAPVDLDSEVASAPVAPLTVELLVEAKDDLVHATLLAVTVNIEYVNEFAPVFDTTSTVDVFENATLNHRIATVRECLLVSRAGKCGTSMACFKPLGLLLD